MSVIRVGTTKKFADNWENIFGGKKKSTPAGKSTGKTAKKSVKKVTSKLAAKKRSAKKKARLKG
jgi:hypothetical protein